MLNQWNSILRLRKRYKGFTRVQGAIQGRVMKGPKDPESPYLLIKEHTLKSYIPLIKGIGPSADFGVQYVCTGIWGL